MVAGHSVLVHLVQVQVGGVMGSGSLHADITTITMAIMKVNFVNLNFIRLFILLVNLIFAKIKTLLSQSKKKMCKNVQYFNTKE